MARPGIQLAGLRATLDPAGLAERRLALRVHGGLLRASEEGLALLLRPTGMLALERITGGHAFVRVEWSGLSAVIELRPSATPQGRLRLEPVSLRALGFLPLPPSTVGLILGAVREKLAGKPGIYLTPGNVLEFDFGEALWHAAGRIGGQVEMPRLKAVRTGEGMLELEF